MVTTAANYGFIRTSDGRAVRGRCYFPGMESGKRRLQVLLDEDRYERLRQRSIRTGRSIGELVQMALDRAESDVSFNGGRADPSVTGPRGPINDAFFLEADIEWFTPQSRITSGPGHD